MSGPGRFSARNSTRVVQPFRPAPEQRRSPFIRGFEVSLLAESGEFAAAKQLADSLAIALPTNIPKPYAVYADLYYQMDSFRLAREYATKAVALDGRNLDASRLLSKARAEIE